LTKRFTYLILSLISVTGLFSQKAEMDSLRSLLVSANVKSMHDTVKSRIMINLSWKLYYSDPDSSVQLTQRAKELAIKSHNKILLGTSYHALGWFYSVKADYALSLENNEMALEIWNELSLPEKKAATLGNIGSVYADMGDYPKALDYHLQSQLICEQLGLKKDIAIGNNNIGLIYFEKNDFEKALSYYFKALKVFEEMKFKSGIQSALSNIGAAYTYLKDHKKALEYLEQALKITEELSDKIGTSTNLGNIGLYFHDSDPDKALVYYEKALELAKETGDKSNIANWQANMGELYLKKGNYSESEKYLSSHYLNFNEQKESEGLMQSNLKLSNLYDKMGQGEKALLNFRRYSGLKDTLFNSEKERAITLREMNFEFDKRQSVRKMIHDKVMFDVETQKKKQRLILWLASAGVFLFVLFFVFIFRSLQITRKQKDIITEQKSLVDEKQKEVLDSIHYARRIQKALMPSEWYMHKNLRSLKN